MQTEPAIYRPPPTEEVTRRLILRAHGRLGQASVAHIAELVSDTVYLERLRFEEDRPEPGELDRLDRATRALGQNDRDALLASADEMIAAYTDEIHNHFSPQAYRIATRILPGALTRLVTAATPSRLFSNDVDPDSRLMIGGSVDHVRKLCELGTVILAPTHLSNLDSPLIGYALYRSGLPPFAYGAGLNLFTNPVMAFWMRRLGTYTVDRRKNGRLYKEVLKDYSVELLRRGVHSLFFPGGTRARSGMVEKSVKKGLLGTGLTAWQENLRDGVERPDVFVVPMTLSTSLVLEAETLIRDSLAREGKARYIILDDEFSRPRTIFSFLKRVLNLDSAVHMRFSAPMDLMGNPVDEQGRSLGPSGQPIDRRRYVCDRDGAVVWDEQRDRIYTDRLAQALTVAYHKDTVALSTHIAAFVAWNLVKSAHPGQDTWRLVRLPREQRRLARVDVLRRVEAVCQRLQALSDAGRICTAYPNSAEALLENAIARFASFHTRHALAPEGDSLVVDMELALYYHNRLVGFGLESLP